MIIPLAPDWKRIENAGMQFFLEVGQKQGRKTNPIKNFLLPSLQKLKLDIQFLLSNPSEMIAKSPKRSQLPFLPHQQFNMHL